MGQVAHKNKTPEEIRDNNRERRLAATQAIQQLLHVLEDPEFQGTIEVGVAGNYGCIGKIRKRTEAWDAPD